MRAIKREDLENILYYQTPKWLFDLLLEGEITPGAYSTYILMYDRTRLSAKNNWVDKNGDVYIKYSYEEMLSDLKVSSKTQIQRNLAKLLELGLIEKKRNFSSSTTYYLNIYSSTQIVVDSSTQIVLPNKNNLNKNKLNNNKRIEKTPTKEINTSLVTTNGTDVRGSLFEEKGNSSVLGKKEFKNKNTPLPPKRKNSNFEKLLQYAQDKFENEKVTELLNQYLQFRIKSGLTMGQWEMMLEDLVSLSTPKKIESIKNSIKGSYRQFYTASSVGKKVVVDDIKKTKKQKVSAEEELDYNIRY